MQRFRAVLPTGDYPNNPEDLIRDINGDFVLYEDAVALINEALEWNWNIDESEINTIPEDVRNKFTQFST